MTTPEHTTEPDDDDLPDDLVVEENVPDPEGDKPE